MANTSKRCVVGYYFDTHSIMEAASKVRDRQFKNFDTFTPFAVHGMDEAMGLKRSWLPYMAFLFGCMGLVGGAFLTIWTHLYNWPLNVGGKPLLALPAYIPVIFETTILLCGVLTTVFMFTVLLGLPNFKKPIFHPDITSDRFALAIEVDRVEEVEPVKSFLRELHAQDIHDVEGSL
ncbi:MAG: hypothetical protein COV44_03840 [Deltaproteobacteria bacterium CG11_big_fil_rev_8_21_14_0_20_45_16]|nr:MAG: hypothetical protein COV44_03840 [Deltaproteobacteria bacterium CG11_big_fil_rev_8_21_14_0_20_45_16]PIS10114.1 MAG: DUF3341 domain-containing protein [Bdellovibrio sp. CG10_big_fil_rev_8_21_14_0_10_47_8]